MIQCDVKVLLLHWGREYRINPVQSQIDLAHTLIDHGADVIIGGHSHVPGKIEIYKGKPILYSMGNFLFDQDWGKKAKGNEFDYIYDYQLARKTVPTYIPLLVSLTIQKTTTGIQILSPQIKMARLDSGIFSALDGDTYSGVLDVLYLNSP